MDILKTSQLIKTMHEDDADADADENAIDYINETKMIFDTFCVNKKVSITFDIFDNFLNKFNVYSPALLPAGNRASEYSTTFPLDYAAHNPGSLLEENSSRRLKVNVLHNQSHFNVYSPALLPAGNSESEYSTTFHLEENSSRRLKVKNFKPPELDEYFCKQVNYTLLVDFILSFYKTDNPTFDAKNITTQSIFEFMVKLGDFFNFVNFLEVDEYFTNYLKYMVTLYLIHLDRDVIEQNFGNTIPIFDDFFVNEIVKPIFVQVEFKDLLHLKISVNNYNARFKEELKDYDPNITYEINNDLDKYFYECDCLSTYSDIIKTRMTTIEVPNPTPQPYINENRQLHQGVFGDYFYSDDDSDDEEIWTPTIYKNVPVLAKDDENYAKYKKQFIFVKYQTRERKYKLVCDEINLICKNVKINDYFNFKLIDGNAYNDFDKHKFMKVKATLGLPYNFKNKLPNDLNKQFGFEIYLIACKYGHFNIAKDFFDHNKKQFVKKNGIIHVVAGMAAKSPNKEILNYLQKMVPNIKHVPQTCYKIKFT